MQGTAKSAEDEFYDVYGLSVVRIPTHKPSRRLDHAPRVYIRYCSCPQLRPACLQSTYCLPWLSIYSVHLCSKVYSEEIVLFPARVNI